MESPLEQKLRELEARATRLEQEIDIETDREVKKSIRLDLSALNNRIAELQKEKNIHLEQNRGNFSFFFVVNFIFSLNLYISCGPEYLFSCDYFSSGYLFYSR